MAHLIEQELPSQLKMEVMFRRPHQKGTQLIRAVENDWHRNGVGNPNQRYGQWQVNAKHDCQAGSHDHLAWKWHKSHEQANCKRARRRTAVQAPEVRVIKQVAKHCQCFVLANDVMLRQVFFNYFFWHKSSFLSGSIPA